MIESGAEPLECIELESDTGSVSPTSSVDGTEGVYEEKYDERYEECESRELTDEQIQGLKNNNALTLNVFGLDAKRYALGFRTNRVSQIDSGSERDLIKGDFNNYGFETKVLSKYKIKNIQSNIVLGLKFYKSSNSSEQGPGSSDFDANFDFTLMLFSKMIQKN